MKSCRQPEADSKAPPPQNESLVPRNAEVDSAIEISLQPQSEIGASRFSPDQIRFYWKTTFSSTREYFAECSFLSIVRFVFAAFQAVGVDGG